LLILSDKAKDKNTLINYLSCESMI